MDGILNRVSPQTWQGTLRGYRVEVFTVNGGWYYAVIDPKGYTVLCPPALTFADGARAAREWVEGRAGKLGNIFLRSSLRPI